MYNANLDNSNNWDNVLLHLFEEFDYEDGPSRPIYSKEFLTRCQELSKRYLPPHVPTFKIDSSMGIDIMDAIILGESDTDRIATLNKWIDDNFDKKIVSVVNIPGLISRKALEQMTMLDFGLLFVGAIAKYGKYRECIDPKIANEFDKKFQ